MKVSQRYGTPPDVLGLVRDVNNLLVMGAGPFGLGEPTPVELLSPSNSKLREQLSSSWLGNTLSHILPKLKPIDQAQIIQQLMKLMLRMGVVERTEVASYPYD